ncbi:MAG: glycosyltransferase [Paracoccaceae bacterium]
MTNKDYSITVIIPTFNEVKNIEKVIFKVREVLKKENFKILFVDDNSNDGTIEEIKKFINIFPDVNLILRIGRRGLSGACIEGIQNSKSSYVAIMDCDLQHDEKLLIKMINEFKEDNHLDLVIGSRHLEEGDSKKGFSYVRDLGSKFAIKTTQKLLKIKSSDPMSGFFMVKKTSIDSLLKKLQPNGFKILADILATSRGNLFIKELGYEFKKRDYGHSKMNLSVVLELIGLLISHLSFGLISMRFVLFGFVGFSGIFVQLIATYFFLKIVSISFFYSQLFSIIITMTSNYYLNNLITFKEHSLVGKRFFQGLISFYFICSIGALANIAIAEKLYNGFGIWYFASFSGALVGAFWNFIFSSIFTWKTR